MTTHEVATARRIGTTYTWPFRVLAFSFHSQRPRLDKFSALHAHRRPSERHAYASLRHAETAHRMARHPSLDACEQPPLLQSHTPSHHTSAAAASRQHARQTVVRANLKLNCRVTWRCRRAGIDLSERMTYSSDIVNCDMCLTAA
jgi:hypothetical protein